jgi:hypothetical protein
MINSISAQFYVSVDEARYNKLIKYGFSKNLGYWFWNIAVMVAPEDTGNLKSSIYLAQNKDRRIKILYDLMKANYALLLEQGRGPVKKYEGFIRFQTTMTITEQLIGWIKTDKEPLFLATNPKPFVELKESKNKPFSWERILLRQADMNANSISAKYRGMISKIRTMDNTGKMGVSRGERVDTISQAGTKGLNKNISKLHQIYLDRKQALRES